jgi:hypothetical protein
MKKLITGVFALFISISSLYSQTTAVDFTADDCDGFSHTLFSELDAGKVVVIAWVMPCSSCSSGAVLANNAVNSFSVSNPGEVLFYLADDFGNTTCTGLTNWANSNNLTNYTVFSTPLVSMNGYGEAGMPKVVILGGNDHRIGYHQNNSGFSESAMTNVISTFLNTASVVNEDSFKNSISIYPNPIVNDGTIDLNLDKDEDVSVQIMALDGKLIYTKDFGLMGANLNQINFSTETINSGTYILKISAGEKKYTQKLIVQK